MAVVVFCVIIVVAIAIVVALLEGGRTFLFGLCKQVVTSIYFVSVEKGESRVVVVTEVGHE
jgi:hypothetical protein